MYTQYSLYIIVHHCTSLYNILMSVTAIDRKQCIEELNELYTQIKNKYEKSTLVKENKFDEIEKFIYSNSQEKYKYVYLKNSILKKLVLNKGIFPEDNISIKLLNNEIKLVDILTYEVKIEPRNEIQHLIMLNLLKNPQFKMNTAYAKKIALKIENSCFKECVTYCSKTLLIIARWTNTEFINYYSSKCGEIISLLDIDSMSCKAYDCILIEKIINGSILPENIGNINIKLICSKAYEEEKKILDVRLSQKIDLKTSVLFRCPHCKARKCNYTVVQRRSLDEAPDYDCVCLVCLRRF